MIPRIKEVKPLQDYMLSVTFDDGKKVIYDRDLKDIYGLFQNYS